MESELTKLMHSKVNAEKEISDILTSFIKDYRFEFKDVSIKVNPIKKTLSNGIDYLYEIESIIEIKI